METVKESFTAAFDESPGKIVHFNCSSSGGTISNLYARNGWKKYIYIYIFGFVLPKKQLELTIAGIVSRRQ